MKNAVLMLAYNNIDLTRVAIESVLAQTIPIHLTVIDNGSTDGTFSMLEQIRPGPPHDFEYWGLPENQSPVRVSNRFLKSIFSKYPHILCTGNDVVFPPDFYETLLQWPRGIVCGAEVRSLPLPDMRPYAAISENTPMSALLLRRWCYDAIISRDGHFFDERYFHYASDCDLALRIASCGIWGIQLNVPYLHHSSATIKNAHPFNIQLMADEAARDRQSFIDKWGFAVDSLEYGARARDLNFKGER